MVDRIKEIREKFFKTQANFSAYLGLSKQNTSDYERGKSTIPTKHIIKLANDYKINPTWLLLGKGNMLLSDTDNINTSQRIKELNDRIKELEFENKLLKELIKK